MAIAAAHSIADYAEKRGITPENIVPTMDEFGVFPYEAADVAMQAIKDGVARVILSREEVYNKAEHDIMEARKMTDMITAQHFIQEPPQAMLDEALEWAISQV